MRWVGYSHREIVKIPMVGCPLGQQFNVRSAFNSLMRCRPGRRCIGWRCGMSYVIAAPEIMTSAATDLATIGSALTAANAAAAAPTTGILAAAQDEVSAAIAAVF